MTHSFKTQPPRDVSRRTFLQRTSLGLAAAAAVELPRVHVVHGAENFEIKIGLIGCGGRGTGAVLDAIGAATRVIYPDKGYHTEDVAEGAKIEKQDIRVVALADLFEDRLTACRGQLSKLGIEIPQARCFTGFEACQQLLTVPEVNYVILATPPHFRPMHLKAAIEAGKHVFLEKPAAVDVPGVKLVIEAGELARQKNLGVAAGTQRRHMRSYQETIDASAKARSARSCMPSATGTAARSGWSIARTAGAIWNGSCATGTTSPGSPAITSWNSTSITST